MPGARRSLASPVVSGVLCPCGSLRAAGAAPGAGTEGSGGGSAGPCGRALCEASEQDRRLRALFQKLDVNRDGALCIHDLAVGLGRLGLHRTELDLLVRAGAARGAGPAVPGGRGAAEPSAAGPGEGTRLGAAGARLLLPSAGTRGLSCSPV